MSVNLAAVTTLTPSLLASQQIAVTTSVAVYTVPAASGAILKTGSLCNVSGLVVAPTGPVATGSTTGGTLAAGSYFYKITSTIGTGESLPSTEASATTTGTTSSVALTWTAATGATGYKVYRGTAAGAENVLVATITGASFTDTNGATTSVAPPTASSTAQAVTVSVSAVQSGGAVDTTHRVINAYSLAANDTLPLQTYFGGLCLGPGDSVHVIAGVVNAVDVVLSGLVNA